LRAAWLPASGAVLFPAREDGEHLLQVPADGQRGAKAEHAEADQRRHQLAEDLRELFKKL
jgi:hypothetical protein